MLPNTVIVWFNHLTSKRPFVLCTMRAHWSVARARLVGIDKDLCIQERSYL